MSRHSRLRAAGLCTMCGTLPPREDKRTCATCARKKAVRTRELRVARGGGRTEAQKVSERKRYRARRAAGLCTQCGQPSDGKTLCRPCQKKQNGYQRKSSRRAYWRARDDGRCPACKTGEAREGKITCQRCADLFAAAYQARKPQIMAKALGRNREMYRRRRAAGDCVRCGKSLARGSLWVQCLSCRIGASERGRRYRENRDG